MKERVIQALIAAAVAAMFAFSANVYDSLKSEIVNTATRRAVTELELMK